ncbi:MAG: hypothetical protein ACKVP4_12230 [Hyphomicrobium sp.]
MLSRFRSKHGKKHVGGRALTVGFQPVDDPLLPIAVDLADILRDIQAIAIDKPAAKARTGHGPSE